MDYEKAYKEALERAKIEQETFFNLGNISAKAAIERIFPKLRESEDERIKNEIIAFVEQSIHRGGGTPISQEQENKWIAWLENQGEQNLSDKVEPKFKVGDWVRAISSGNIFKILSVNDGLYHVLCYDGVEANYPMEVEKDLAYWTIQDAKDGDVLYDNYTNTVLIFKSQTCGWIKVYCDFWINKNKFTGTDIADYGRVSEMDLNPATKSQHDILFQKMKEEGYEWDADKKELKNIEQKSTWSEEDEYQINTILHGIDLKKEKYKKEGNKVEQERYQNQYNWLKSIKDRVQPQPKQEWSKEDERNSAFIVAAIDAYSRIRKENDNKNGQDDFDKAVNWIHNRLKYLHPQLSQNWKPSEEQLKTLWDAICYVEDDINSNFVGGCMLESLYNDLKKL